jgi:hypothetical protein
MAQYLLRPVIVQTDGPGLAAWPQPAWYSARRSRGDKLLMTMLNSLGFTGNHRS